MHKRMYYLTLTSLLTALSTVGGSFFVVSVGVAKATPMQHLINVLAGVLLGPWWSLMAAFLTSILRNILGTGGILAFPGSMIGAFCSGWLFYKTKNLIGAALGELIGTGFIGALVAYPIARLFLGAQGAVWLFIPSFFISSLVGSIMAYILLKIIWKPIIKPQLEKLQNWKN